jgi:hypothetical protein
MLANALAANGTLLCASRLPPAGVECHRGHVRSLTIRSAGTLPTELGRLPALQSLTIAAPSLMGTLPTQLGSLATLQQLKAVRSDRLSGTLPPRLGGVCGTEAPPMAAHNAWASACHFSTELRLSLPRLSGTLYSLWLYSLWLYSLWLYSLWLYSLWLYSLWLYSLWLYSLWLYSLWLPLIGTLPERLPGVGVGLLDLRGCSRLSGTLPSWLGSIHHALLGQPQPTPSPPPTCAPPTLTRATTCHLQPTTTF